MTAPPAFDVAALRARILFENQHVVAVDKSPGVLTVPARTGAEDPRPCLGRQLETTLGLRLWPVHRLDFEVGGVVLFAKTAAAHQIANHAFENRRVDKRYEALTEGAAQLPSLPTRFTWESRLVRGKRRSFEAPHGKPARTVAEALARVPADLSDPDNVAATSAPRELVHFALFPETGRPHQLRVHLARAGFPIAGDRLYGASFSLRSPDAIALRAVSLAFVDTDTCAALGLTAPLQVSGYTAAR